MDNIKFYNHKYNSIESLLTNTGNLNTAIVRRDWFKKLNIYQEIFLKSESLNIFNNVQLKDRIFFIKDNMNISFCPVCQKEYIYFSKSQKMYKCCNHKFNSDYIKNKIIRKQMWDDKKQKLLNSLTINPNYLIEENNFNVLVDYYYTKPNNYNFIITEQTFNFFHDVILKTKDILNIDPTKLDLSQRIYIIKNNLIQLPTCKFCNNLVSFKGRNIGYATACKEHLSNLASNTKKINSIIKLQESIDLNKYEIIKLPTKMSSEKLIIKCKKCQKNSEWIVKDGMLNTIFTKYLCRHCEINYSNEEKELFEFISINYNNTILKNTRNIISPLELDIYIPEKKLAIEFDGLYWHSELNKEKDYHLNKTELCEKQNIQLIHVFENEWLYKRNIIESRLKNLLGIYDNIVYARNCEVKIIDKNISKQFQDENHIQGSVNATVNLGLYYNNELISLMTFGKSRFRKNYIGYELLRFCNKLGYHIPGAAGKLLKYFERNYKPKSLISYADRRWSRGNVYEKLGFKLIGKSKPNYWYFKLTNKLYSRMNFQKHKLKNILENYNENLSESENMKLNGYNRIYDCGNLVYVKEY